MPDTIDLFSTHIGTHQNFKSTQLDFVNVNRGHSVMLTVQLYAFSLSSPLSIYQNVFSMDYSSDYLEKFIIISAVVASSFEGAVIFLCYQ